MQRQGAGAVYLNVFHPDIIEFLSTKKENADEKVRVKTLSLGLVVPDKFYELARKNQDMYLFSPYSIQREYGVPFSQIDITEKYDELVLNQNIRKKKLMQGNLKKKFRNYNKNLVIHTFLMSIQPTDTMPLTEKL